MQVPEHHDTVLETYRFPVSGVDLIKRLLFLPFGTIRIIRWLAYSKSYKGSASLVLENAPLQPDDTANAPKTIHRNHKIWVRENVFFLEILTVISGAQLFHFEGKKFPPELKMDLVGLLDSSRTDSAVSIRKKYFEVWVG